MTEYVIRKIDFKKDLIPLSQALFKTQGKSQLDTSIKGLTYIYRRFPVGCFVVENGEEVFGVLNLGFQRPDLLTKVLGKLPIAFPEKLFLWLVRLRILQDFEVANIHISEEYRGKGRMAIKLMKLAEEEARHRWDQRQIVLMVRESNERSVKFYKRLGYQEFGRIKVGQSYKLRMKKLLD